MVVAKLTRVTVIAPRSDYQNVLARLAKFDDFHLIEEAGNFDPDTEELTVRAVRLFAQVDQAVRDLAIPLLPGTIDIVFRGATVPETTYEAQNWDALLSKAEKEAEPILAEVRGELDKLAQLQKDEADTAALIASIQAISNISTDIGLATGLRRLRVFLSIVNQKSVPEIEKSVSGFIFLSQPVASNQALVLIAGAASEFSKVDRVIRAFELKPLSLPETLPQNPLEAFRSLGERMDSVVKARTSCDSRVQELREKYSEQLLAIREIAHSANSVLDDVRTSGKLMRVASVSGFVPTKRREEFQRAFDTWIVVPEQVPRHEQENGHAGVPTLMVNSGPARSFEKITENQGFPGRHEVDPTPIVTFVFPVFFGMMFADFGHGLVVTVFSLILRSRKDRNIRAWGNIFLAAGISAMIFGILLGEVFGFDLGQIVPLPAFLPVVTHGTGPLFYQASLNYSGVLEILTIALLIGIAHIITGMSLDIYQAARSGDRFELLVEKVPTLIMYVSGLGFGLAFIQANFSFNILSTPLGLISTIVVLAVAIEVIVWKGIATIMGKIHDESVPMAFVGGLIELLVKISEFLSNTISYARLGILLLVHAALLLALNLFFQLPVYEAIVPVVIFNIMIIVLEALIVYIQDLRLHLYEFFTKFYEGSGTPFRKLLPDSVRTKITWT